MNRRTASLVVWESSAYKRDYTDEDIVTAVATAVWKIEYDEDGIHYIEVVGRHLDPLDPFIEVKLKLIGKSLHVFHAQSLSDVFIARMAEDGVIYDRTRQDVRYQKGQR